MDCTQQRWLDRLAAASADSRVRLEFADWLERRRCRSKSELLRLGVEAAKLELKSQKPRFPKREWSRLYDIRSRLETLSKRVDVHWLTQVDPALQVPVELSDLGRKAALAIAGYVAQCGWTYCGLTRAFHTPAEAEKMGYETGPAILMVSHLCHLLDECLGIDPRHEAMQVALSKRLRRVGAWTQLYDDGASLIYPKDYAGPIIALRRGMKPYRNW